MSREQVSEVLRVRELLSKGWTQEAYARDAEFNECEATAPEAARFCILGACEKVWAEMGHNPVSAFLSEIMAIGYQDVPTYNDDPERTKEDVLGLCDKIIKTIEKVTKVNGI